MYYLHSHFFNLCFSDESGKNLNSSYGTAYEAVGIPCFFIFKISSFEINWTLKVNYNPFKTIVHSKRTQSNNLQWNQRDCFLYKRKINQNGWSLIQAVPRFSYCKRDDSESERSFENTIVKISLASQGKQIIVVKIANFDKMKIYDN